MDKVKIIIGIIVLWIIIVVIRLPGEYVFLTSKTTQGKICSERFIKKEHHLGSKNVFYVYKVEYTVNDQVYQSEQFEAANDSYQYGDVVQVRYNNKHPERVVRSQIPIIWIVTIIFLAVLIEQMAKK